MLGIKIPCVILFYTNQLTHSIENASVSRNEPVFFLKLDIFQCFTRKTGKLWKISHFFSARVIFPQCTNIHFASEPNIICKTKKRGIWSPTFLFISPYYPAYKTGPCIRYQCHNISNLLCIFIWYGIKWSSHLSRIIRFKFA